MRGSWSSKRHGFTESEEVGAGGVREAACPLKDGGGGKVLAGVRADGRKHEKAEACLVYTRQVLRLLSESYQATWPGAASMMTVPIVPLFPFVVSGLDMSVAVVPETIIADGVFPPIRVASFPAMEALQAEGLGHQPDIAGAQIKILATDHADIFITIPGVAVGNHHRLFDDHRGRSFINHRRRGRGRRIDHRGRGSVDDRGGQSHPSIGVNDAA
jgi:hypothetical protein